MKIGDYEDENFVGRPNLSGAIQLKNKILVSLSGFLSDPGVPGVRSMGPDVSHSLTHYKTMCILN